MQEKDIKVMKQVLGDDLNQLQVVIVRSDLPARPNSPRGGWVVQINKQLLRSSRALVRVFGTLDTAEQELAKMGIESFTVLSNRVVSPTRACCEFVGASDE